jgi:hypothetical protein
VPARVGSRWLLAKKQRQARTKAAQPAEAPPRPVLQEVSRFMLLERDVEIQHRPLMLEALQDKVNAAADSLRGQTPACSQCGQSMKRHDIETVSWDARFGRLQASVARYRCPACQGERRPLLDLLGVEPGRISGSLARLLALLAVVAPYPLAAQLAWLLLGVEISAMGVWNVVQRLGESAARYSEGLSQYHADSRSEGASTREAPHVVVLSVDGCMLGMQVRTQRRRRQGDEVLPPLPPVEEGRFHDVKTGVLLLPSERVQTSPGRHSLVRRFLVSCLGNADAIFARLYAQLRELGWVSPDTVVVIVGDGAEWIWNRATMFVRRCEILDFWHALEHAWGFARLNYGEGSQQAAGWVHRIAEDLRAGKVEQVIARLKRMRITVCFGVSLSGGLALCGPKRRSCAKSYRASSPTTASMPGACTMTNICVWATGSAVALWRARISRWCMPASDRPACAGVRLERPGYWRYDCCC